MSKVVVAFVVLCLLFLHHLAVEADQMNQAAGESNPAKSYGSSKINCGVACAARCLLSSRQNLCHQACGTCCARCNCVPPGTSGNHHVCPCYATMTTHGGRLKCP